MARILEYTPAPGQFINEEARSGGAFDNVDTPEKACRYAAARFAENNWVSLGGWGGYLVAAFAEPVPNTGGYDLYVKGNAMNTSSEPGVVWVMQDANGNGVPDDTWYELKGSEYDNAATIRGMRSPTRRSPTAPPHGPTTGAAAARSTGWTNIRRPPTARHGSSPPT
ncbi:MAG: hypothetical protein ACLSH3_01195 [Alistipes finegoldii]